MIEALVAIVSGLITFAITTVDDIFVLTLLFSNRGASASAATVAIGHFCGFTLLLIVTLVAFLSLRAAFPSSGSVCLDLSR